MSKYSQAFAAAIAGLLILSVASVLGSGQKAFAQNQEHVDFAANLEFIKGHLTQAVANKEANNNELAIAHAGHPVHEIYSLIEEELSEHNSELNTELKNALTTLENEINTISTAETQTRVDAINGMIDEANTSVVSQSERDDPKFNSMVAISLLETAEVEYEEAVSEGQIVEMVEYQDATAFIARAQSIFTAIESDLPEHEAEEIEEFFGELNSLTSANAPFEDVQTMIGGIIHEFEEAAGLEEGSTQQADGWAYIDRIKELLDESVAEYNEGNTQRARALAVEAYLDNYEFIESDIEQDDPELMEKIEVDIRESLVQMIDNGAPAAEIESHVEMIKTDLEIARAVVTPEFPLPVVGAIAAVIGIVAFLGRTKIAGKIA